MPPDERYLASPLWRRARAHATRDRVSQTSHVGSSNRAATRPDNAPEVVAIPYDHQSRHPADAQSW